MAAHANLTEAQRERLEMLVEECGEVIQAATKVLRHGYDESSPFFPDTTNKQDLCREIVDLATIVDQMDNDGDLSVPVFVAVEIQKARWAKKLEWTFHQRHTPE